jgi:hypothetical protein
LSPAAEAEVRQHLAECAGCRDSAGGIEDSLALLRSAHEEPIAAGHYTAVRAGVLARLERERRTWRRWAWAAGPAAGLAVAAAATFVALRPVEKARVTVAAVRRPEAPAAASRTHEEVVPPVPAPRPRVRRAAAPRPRQPVEPLVVKLITNDPDVVIYWIADRKGEKE